jgi:UDP-N-acetylmuramoyl-L-alanyl-D-glutamate--2,6-diaminopimelate ligase
MAGMDRMGISHVAYEASSHGLDQYRAEGVPVKAAAFTNFSRDHLDYHSDMDDYFAAKMRLFDEVVEADGTAVVWTGDAKSQEVIGHAKRRGLKLITVGPEAGTIELVSRTSTPLGQQLVLRHEGKEHKLALPLIGAYQMNNVLTAAGLALATGADWATTLSGMARVSPVRGRLERAVITHAGAPVYIDYAHTPDAIEAAIGALRPHVEGRLITVLGAGGDRDHGKRPEMGAVAARMSDVVIVTDDNPRSEDPAAIRAAVLAGAHSVNNGAIEIGDRRSAIGEAIAMAKAGDIVLVAGKGHEQGQILGDQVLPFDDVTVARECAA